MVLILVGPPAVGKSTLGRALARQLDLPFLDSDELLSEGGLTPARMIAEHGEAAFRVQEQELVLKVLENPQGIIALGGGSVISSAVRERLMQLPVVFLKGTSELVSQRLNSASRPLTGSVAHWNRVVRERLQLYESVATHTLLLNGDSSLESSVNELKSFYSLS